MNLHSTDSRNDLRAFPPRATHLPVRKLTAPDLSETTHAETASPCRRNPPRPETRFPVDFRKSNESPTVFSIRKNRNLNC